MTLRPMNGHRRKMTARPAATRAELHIHGCTALVRVELAAWG
jgi:hypothetical protein